MSYVDDNLLPNEKVLLYAHIHPAVLLPAAIIFFLTIGVGIFSFGVAGQAGSTTSTTSATSGVFLCISGLLLIYSIVLVLQALIIMNTTEFAITDRRVIAKTGFVRRHTLEMLLTKIESVAVGQSILGRMLNFGTVTVTGTGGTKESFKAIGQPFDVRKKINQIIEQSTQAFTQPQQGGGQVAATGQERES